MASFVVKQRGLQTTIKFMKDLNRRLDKQTRREILTDMGGKVRDFAKNEIVRNAAVWKGDLWRSITMRVYKDHVTIFSTSPIKKFVWESGGRWNRMIYRNMLTERGNTVGEWMDSKGFNPAVRGFIPGRKSVIGLGIQYMEKAAYRLKVMLPQLNKEYSERIFSGLVNAR